MEESLGHEELWEHAADGQSLCALINGNRGWLMYVRSEGDTGLRSADPDFAGDPGEEMEFVLENGQRDSYPLAWTLPVALVREALSYFRIHARPAPFVTWRAS